MQACASPHASLMPWSGFQVGGEPFLSAFPTEIEENIIDQLSGNTRALCSCALTCRAWLPRSRLHLLHAIYLRDEEQLTALYDALEKYPHRRLLVHSVTTAPKRKKAGRGSVIEIFPLALLTQLPNLRCWKINQTTTKLAERRETLSLHRTTSICLRYSSIDKLYLTSLRFASYAELVRLVLALPSLCELHCGDLQFAALGSNLESLKSKASHRLSKLFNLQVSHCFLEH